MKVIGIDLDDVMFDFINPFLRIAHETLGHPELGTLPVDWEWSNVLPSKEEQKAVWDVALSHNDWWENWLPACKGASGEMLRALDAKYTLYFPTARVETMHGRPARKQAAIALERVFGIDHPAVIVAYEKGPMATALKYDYFIDDRPKNCLDIQKALPNCKVYLKDSSHNRAFDAEANGMTRIKDFDTFAKLLLEGRCL